ncbi:MAG: DUF6900 domain-containing protein [Phycisphaerales bacterium JB063]
MTNAKPTKTALKTIERIAREELDLETRNWDSYDFHEHAVWCIKKALLDAYAAGFEAGKKSRPRNAK